MARKKIFVVICMVAFLGLLAGNAFAWSATGTVHKIRYDATGAFILVDIGGGVTKGGYVDAGTDEKAVLACALTAQADGSTVVKLTILSGLITGIEVQ